MLPLNITCWFAYRCNVSELHKLYRPSTIRVNSDGTPKYHWKGERRGSRGKYFGFNSGGRRSKPVPFFETLPVSQRVRQARFHNSTHNQANSAWKKDLGQFGIETLLWNRQNQRRVSFSYTQIGPVYFFIKLGKKPIKFREEITLKYLKKSPN